MLGLNPTTLLASLVGALALFGAGAWLGYDYRDGKAAQEKLAAERTAIEIYKEDVERMNRLGREQVAREQERERDAELLQRALVKVVERPVYRDRACTLDDDGLRLLNAAIAGQGPGGREPDHAVRSGAAAGHAGHGGAAAEGGRAGATPQPVR